MNSIEYQTRLFGANLIEVVPELKPFETEVENFFSDICSEPPSLNTNNHLEDVECAVKILLDQEKNHATTLQKLFDSIPTSQQGLFLSDQTIEFILLELPPIMLHQLIKKQPNISSLSSRLKLSLTRFTETADWNVRYKRLLSQLPISAFTYRKPECHSVPLNLLPHHQYAEKPWSLSHGKETGIVFILENSYTKTLTPNLLKLSVALHYFYEVYTCGVFINLSEKEKISERLHSVIFSSHSPKLSFLTDRNAHDETWYWQQAFKTIHTLVDKRIHENSLAGTITLDDLRSYHWVDTIWSANNIHGRTNHRYHLRQECWQALLKKISGMTDDDFSTHVMNRLDVDNYSFMIELLSKN